jgi:hypothetical protein
MVFEFLQAFARFFVSQPLGNVIETTLGSVETFVTTFQERIRAGTSLVADTLFDTIMDGLVRRLENQARRL